MPKILILGTRGVPGRHGGFETFAERLALHLTGRGWNVAVACQSEMSGSDRWRGVLRLHYRSWFGGPFGTVLFDLRSVLDAMRRGGPVLTLGYNTGLFGLLLRLAGVRQIVNMDGVEWRRSKWPVSIRLWFRVNEWLAARLADHLVADHPEIARHLGRHTTARKITMIPYGADPIDGADAAPVIALGLTPDRYALVVARAEPENSIREIVTAYGRRRRDCRLVVLGGFDTAGNAYHRAVRAAAGPDVLFPGAIYDAATLAALRRHARLYVHGHQVGGTNPSLVEALGAGCPVLAHANRFNRWVAGPAMRYFTDIDSCAEGLDALLAPAIDLSRMRQAARARVAEDFTWTKVLSEYERLLAHWQSPPAPCPPSGSVTVD